MHRAEYIRTRVTCVHLHLCTHAHMILLMTKNSSDRPLPGLTLMQIHRHVSASQIQIGT